MPPGQVPSMRTSAARTALHLTLACPPRRPPCRINSTCMPCTSNDRQPQPQASLSRFKVAGRAPMWRALAITVRWSRGLATTMPPRAAGAARLVCARAGAQGAECATRRVLLDRGRAWLLKPRRQQGASVTCKAVRWATKAQHIAPGVLGGPTTEPQRARPVFSRRTGEATQLQ